MVGFIKALFVSGLAFFGCMFIMPSDVWAAGWPAFAMVCVVVFLFFFFVYHESSNAR